MVHRLVVYCIRHGLTEWNEERRYIGWTDQPLSSRGVTEVNIWMAPQVERVYSSDLLRASQTAKILYPRIPIRKDAAFREYDFGTWEGKTYEQLKNDLAYRQWLDEPSSITPPDGEAFISFTQRVREAWSKLLKELTDQGVCSVTFIAHGGTIRSILQLYSGQPFWKWHVHHGIAIKLYLEKDGEGEYRCISLQEVPLTESVTGL